MQIANIGDFIQLEGDTEVYQVIGRYWEGAEEIGVHYLDAGIQFTAIDGSYSLVASNKKQSEGK